LITDKSNSSVLNPGLDLATLVIHFSMAVPALPGRVVEVIIFKFVILAIRINCLFSNFQIQWLTALSLVS